MKPTTSNYLPVRDAWLRLCQEAIFEPNLPIIDAHHHFCDRPGWRYLADDYLADVRSGHNVQASVYMQAQTRYRTEGPEALRPVGETAYVAAVADQHTGGGPRLAAGIVGHADLRAGARVREVLEEHVQAGRGHFKGVRHLTTWDADASLVNPLSSVPPGLLLDKSYREGVAQLAPLGLSYDACQLPELLDLAKAFPDTPVIVNHCGGVVRIASYQERRDALDSLRASRDGDDGLGGLELKALLEHAMASKSSSEWWTLLNEAGVPAGPVYSVREALEHPQIAERGMLATFKDAPGVGRDIRIVRTGFKMNGQAPSVSTPPPRLGQHSAEILEELGYTPQEVRRLREEAAV